MDRKHIKIAIIFCILIFFLAGCDGSSSSSRTESKGPLAGTWMGTAAGVMHTIKISGDGNQYKVTWRTSNDCFKSDKGTAIHINNKVEILCSGYDGGRDRYTYPDIYGEYDGGNAISGRLHNITCGTDEGRIPIVITR